MRPEKLRLSREPAATGPNQASGVVEDLAYLGSQSTYYVRLDGGKLIRAAAPNFERRSGHRLAIGDRVHIGWSPDAAVVLDS